MVEPQYNRTHYSEHISTENYTKAIVARAMVTKKKGTHVLHFCCNGFQCNEHSTTTNNYWSMVY